MITTAKAIDLAIKALNAHINVMHMAKGDDREYADEILDDKHAKAALQDVLRKLHQDGSVTIRQGERVDPVTGRRQ